MTGLNRFLSKQRLVFSVGGAPLCSGNGGNIKGRGEVGQRLGGGTKAYMNLIRLSAKMAMAASNWELTDKPIYITACIFVGIGSEKHPAVIKEMYANKRLADRLPDNLRIATLLTKSLRGLVYKRNRQIIALLVVKKYSKEPRVDVTVGVPENYFELAHDIRNA